MKVFIDIYSRPTDLKRHVSFKSNHPKHCLKNIPFSFACRTCMITEKDSLKEIKLKELETLQRTYIGKLETLLLEQHYPERILKAGINKVLKIPQNELRNVINKKQNPQTLHIIAKQTLENLKTVDQMRNTLKKVKFIKCK